MNSRLPLPVHSLRISLVPWVSFALVACSSTTSTPASDAGADAATFAIAPTTANVATCRSKTFVATPADGVTWSLDGAGTIDAGKYTAPTAVPAPPTATVKAAREALTATATVSLATAFPESAKDAPRATAKATPDFVRGTAARGARVYTLVPGDAGPQVARSDDGGLTFGAPVPVSAGTNPVATAIAVDAGSDDVVYVTIRGDKSGSGSTLDLLTSTDGGKTFSAKPLFSGGNGEVVRADVVSPAPNVVVAASRAEWQDGNGGQGSTLLVFKDGNRGATLPALTNLDNGYGGTWALGQEFRLAAGHVLESGDRLGPHFATNGAGKVCLAYADSTVNETTEAHLVRCSEGGAPFGAAVTTASGKPADIDRPRIALSKDGTVLAVAYDGFANHSVDSIGKSHYRVSTDGGATFGEDRVLDGAKGTDGLDLAVAFAEPFVDSENVLWIARTLATSSVEVDKSCDRGVTRSGRFVLPIPTSHRDGAFFESSAGLFATVLRRSAGDDLGFAHVRLLAP
ncbi:MAG: hypothetical protein U0169_07135 [Polyangiaceae bacterium]